MDRRRPKDSGAVDFAGLAAKTEGFSGADIEGVVKDAIEAAFAEGKERVQTEDILNAIKNTHSLKETMKESIERMEKEYQARKFKNASG